MHVGIRKSSLIRTLLGAQSQWTLYPSGKSISVRKSLLPTIYCVCHCFLYFQCFRIVANVEDNLALTCGMCCRYHVGRETLYTNFKYGRERLEADGVTWKHIDEV